MSELHLQYMKDLCAGITLDGQQPFVARAVADPEQSRFLEIKPPLDTFQELIPFVVIKHFPMKPDRNGKRSERLSRAGSNLRFLRNEFDRRFKYRMDFWMNDPAQEILSNTIEIGITEQIQLYLVSNERFLNGESTVKVELGSSGTVEDPDGSTGLFYVYQEIFFNDDLCQVEEVQSLANAQYKTNLTEVLK